MKTTNKFIFTAIAVLASSSLLSAQQRPDNMPPPPNRERDEFRNEDRKQERQEMREEWRNRKEDMKGEMRNNFKNDFKGPTLNATQTATIANKLGITIETLNAKLASGTKLKEIIKDKIKPGEMKIILPPQTASFTRAVEEKGFINKFRASIFGERKEVGERSVNEFGEVTISTSTISVPNTPFWKKFFSF